MSAKSNKLYDDWHSRLPVDVAADTPWHRLIRAHMQPDRDICGKYLLEIGCGRGGFACSLATTEPGPAGIVAEDFSSVAVLKGRAFGNSLDRVHFAVGDIQKIAHPDSTFHTVISCETIEHVPRPKEALLELARVLKPGGRLFLTTPNYLGTYGLYRVYRRLTCRPYTEEGQPINNCFFLPLVASWVRETGLRVVTVDGIGHYMHIPGRVPVELPALNSARWFTRWFALHSLIVAYKDLF